MSNLQRTSKWLRVLVLVGGVGMFHGFDILAFAEEKPTTAIKAVSVLSGDQAIAFHSGYIHQQEQISGMVLRGREDKQLFSQGDILFLKLSISSDAKAGSLLTLYRPTRQVFHPMSREPLGRLIVIVGVLEVVNEPADGVSEARIIRAFDTINRGDLVMPFKAPPPVPAQQVSSGPLTGIIVDVKDQRQLTASTDIVYIDRGERDGVALGDRFSVLRIGRRQSPTSKDPDQRIGEIKIIRLQPTMATAFVLKSTDALLRGDTITRLPPPATPKPQPAGTPSK